MFTELWAFAFAWYNVPFTFLLGLCLLVASFQLIGLGVDHDHDFDADAEADLEADADTDADGGADSDAEHDLAHETEAGGVSPLAVLAYVGFGKAPLLVVLLLLCSTIGLAGWGLNGLVHGLGVWANLLVMPVAVVAGAVSSARLARWLGRALPSVTSTATRAAELVGVPGRVTSPQVNQQFGQVHVRAADGTLLNIFAITDSPVPIQRGERVVLVAYDRPSRRYWVIPAPNGLPEPAHEH
jgi:hypothetical protein